MRTLTSYLGWPIGILAIVGLVWGLLLLAGDLVPDLLNGLLAAIGVVALVVMPTLQRRASFRFWLIRVRARIGRGVTPAWQLSVGLRARLGPSDRIAIEERLARRLPNARLTFLSERRAELDRSGARLTIEWVEPIVDAERELVDWRVDVSSDHPRVPYDDSIRFLRHDLMPVLEAVDEALETTARDYHLTVVYGPNGNPFEGLIVQGTPAEAVATYQVLIKPSSGETIHLMKDRVMLSAQTRSRFEEAVERLLTLNGAWRARIPTGLG